MKGRGGWLVERKKKGENAHLAQLFDRDKTIVLMRDKKLEMLARVVAPERWVTI